MGVIAAEFTRAVDYWRWCWDCGTTIQDCRASTSPAGKCCPDCRHRDGDTVARYRANAHLRERLAALESAASDALAILDGCATGDPDEWHRTAERLRAALNPENPNGDHS